MTSSMMLLVRSINSMENDSHNELFNGSTNTSNTTLYHHHQHYRDLNKTVFIFRATLSILSLLLNGSVVSIFMYMSTTKKRFKKVNFLFSLQAIADIIVTISMDVYTATTFDADLMWHEPTKVGIFFYEYSQSLALCVLLLMTIERFLAIKFPVFHRVHSSLVKICSLAAVGLSISFISPVTCLFFIIPIRHRAGDKHHVLMKMEFYLAKGTIGIFTITIVFVLLFVLYTVIRANINSRIHYINSTRSTLNINVRVHIEERKHRRVVLILLSMCSIYVVTLLPGSLYMICFHSSQETEHEFVHWTLEYSFTTLYFSSSLMNPLITLFFHKDYRRVLRHCKIRKLYSMITSRSRLYSDDEEHLLIPK